MISFDTFKSNKDVRDEILDDSKYEVIAYSNKPKFLVIDYEFAKTLPAEIQDILSECVGRHEKSAGEKIKENKHKIQGMLESGMKIKEVAEFFNIPYKTLDNELSKQGLRSGRHYKNVELFLNRGEEVVEYIKKGWSLNRLSMKFNVSSKTIQKYFEKELKSRKYKKQKTTNYQFIQG